MGKDRDSQFRNFNCASNVAPPAPPKQSTNSMVFPNCGDPYGFFHLNSGLMPPSNPTGFASGQKTFVVFDQSGDQRSLFFSSLAGTQFPYPNPNFGLGLGIPGSNETNVSNGNVNEEMHEDTEEIDALLYSDSENDYEEEEASTGHSPYENTTRNFEDDNDDNEEEEVASSAVVQPLQPPPAKRRRVETEIDPSLADTASSTHCANNEERKKAKKERIQETVGVLRRIIPGGKGKDAADVLDEAIRYLKSLRLKAKGLGVGSTLK